MASMRYETRIRATADEVWRVVTEPTSIVDWFPGIVSCVVDDKLRTITTATGLELPEEILTNDPLLRRFAYRVTLPIFKFHLGVIDVIELSPEESLCIYSTTAEPDVMALIIAGGTKGALDEIKRLAESKAEAN